MTETTMLEYDLSRSTVKRLEESDPSMDPRRVIFFILGYELIPLEGWAPEAKVLSTEGVTEALHEALGDFEEWRNSL